MQARIPASFNALVLSGLQNNLARNRQFQFAYPIAFLSSDTRPVTAAVSFCYANSMVFSRAPILDALLRLPLISKGELAFVLGEPLARHTSVLRSAE